MSSPFDDAYYVDNSDQEDDKLLKNLSHRKSARDTGRSDEPWRETCNYDDQIDERNID